MARRRALPAAAAACGEDRAGGRFIIICGASCGPGGGRGARSWPWREASAAGRSDPWRVLDRAKRPVAFQPCADRVVEHRVDLRTVRAYPGTDGRIMVTRADAAPPVA